MKESSLQTQSGISFPSQQRTCMQCMAREQGWKPEAKPLNMGSLHGQATDSHHIYMHTSDTQVTARLHAPDVCM